MKKTQRILITGGPTAEPIDEVMRIITFSSGSLSIALSDFFLEGGDEVCLVVYSGVNTSKLDKYKKVEIVRVDTTVEMMDAIHRKSKEKKIDVLLHTAAVGDYMADFTFLMEDMAEEIFKSIDSIKTPGDILKIMRSPGCKLRDDSKISSYQENLTVKLGLTPKIIAKLREWMPDTILFGCKLLENVDKNELFTVASALCKRIESIIFWQMT